MSAVIVGGGLTGLATALLLTPLYDRVVVFEQNATASSPSHHVTLEWDDVPAFAKPLVAGLPREGERASIENILCTAAQEKGVEIITKKITSLVEIREHVPDAVLVVGADGAKSWVREKINYHSTPIERERVAVLTYTTHERAKPMSLFKKYATFKEMGMVAGIEFVEGRRVTLVYPLPDDDAVIADEHERPFDTPVTLLTTLSNEQQALEQHLRFWVNARRDACGDLLVPGSARIRCTQLCGPYAAGKFAYPFYEKMQVCIVGSAAFGLPLNDTGLYGVSQLVRVLNINPGDRDGFCGEYQAVMAALAADTMAKIGCYQTCRAVAQAYLNMHEITPMNAHQWSPKHCVWFRATSVYSGLPDIGDPEEDGGQE